MERMCNVLRSVRKNLANNLLVNSIISCVIDFRTVGITSGGEDFDHRMMDYCISQFKKQHNGIDLSLNPKAIAKIRRQCESAKRTLSIQKSAQIEV